MTEGGPLSSTYVLALYIYDQSFRYFNLGYGAALSWVLFALVAALAGISFWSSASTGCSTPAKGQRRWPPAALCDAGCHPPRGQPPSLGAALRDASAARALAALPRLVHRHRC